MDLLSSKGPFADRVHAKLQSLTLYKYVGFAVYCNTSGQRGQPVKQTLTIVMCLKDVSKVLVKESVTSTFLLASVLSANAVLVMILGNSGCAKQCCHSRAAVS